MNLAALRAEADTHALAVFGTLPTRPEDGLGDGTIALLGPREPGFWSHVTSQPEFGDGVPDPMDRWSARVVDELAIHFRGKPLFPFGTPVHPFVSWALRSHRAWQSPVRLLVHDTAGLLVSYRGAILLPDRMEEAPKRAAPCETCAGKPCLTACPVSALTANGYDLDACHTYLDARTGRSCMSRGCEVRRACPVSQNYGRSEHQSSFHMDRFHPCR